MDLSYGSEMEGYREEVKAFLADNWPLKGDEAKLDYNEGAALFRERAIAAGYLCRNIPKRYGGSEQPHDVLKSQIIREEFSKAWAPMEVRGIGTMMLVPTLLERGEEWQKEKFVRDTISGRIQWCQGYSEPGAGSDLASLTTRGELVGDEWVINGQKIWTSAAHVADYMFALVRTEPDAPKHAGISYLLLDMHQPGIEVRPLRQMTGGADFNEVFLTDARTPKDWMVGKRGEGWIVSRTTLKHERNSIGSTQQTRAGLRDIVKLAKHAQRGGRPALEDPEIRQRIAALEGYVRAHQYSGYRQLTQDAKGGDAGIIDKMVKLMSTNINHTVADISMDLIDDEGLLAPGTPSFKADARASQQWISRAMYAMGIAVAGGTANIQRNVIAERGLGLPRDMAADAGSGKGSAGK